MLVNIVVIDKSIIIFRKCVVRSFRFRLALFETLFFTLVVVFLLFSTITYFETSSSLSECKIKFMNIVHFWSRMHTCLGISRIIAHISKQTFANTNNPVAHLQNDWNVWTRTNVDGVFKRFPLIHKKTALVHRFIPLSRQHITEECMSKNCWLRMLIISTELLQSHFCCFRIRFTSQCHDVETVHVSRTLKMRRKKGEYPKNRYAVRTLTATYNGKASINNNSKISLSFWMAFFSLLWRHVFCFHLFCLPLAACSVVARLHSSDTFPVIHLAVRECAHTYTTP